MRMHYYFRKMHFQFLSIPHQLVKGQPHERELFLICDRFWENRPKRGKQFFSVSPGKALWVDFFQKKIMAEMDRHQLALAYDAVVSSGVL